MKTLTLAVAAALAFGTATTSAVAQTTPAATRTPSANTTKYGVAVVDISKIFENHKDFKSIMQKMKDDMKSIDTQLKAKRDKLMKMEEARNGLQPGSQEYKELDDQIATERAKLGLEMERLRKSLMERESKVYFQTYQQIAYVVGQYAEQRQIGLVIKYSSAKPNESNSGDILKHINRPVVYHSSVDITSDILAILNRSASSSTPSSQAARPGGLPLQN